MSEYKTVCHEHIANRAHLKDIYTSKPNGRAVTVAL
jgi:hypothetical protein